MNIFFSRRKHQRLDEISVELPADTDLHGESDTSSGRNSTDSPDLSTFTSDAMLGNSLLTNAKTKPPLDEYPCRILPPTSTKLRFWQRGWGLNRIDQTAKRRNKALAELDRTIMQIRRKNYVLEKSQSKNVSRYNGGKDDPLCKTESEISLPREVTWKRRVSSLEAMFRKDNKQKSFYNRERSFESSIVKINPLDSKLRPFNTDDDYWDSLYIDFRPKYGRSKPTFEETVEQGVSEIIEKITSRGEEILENVPDWSVASSSVDYMSTATSDDDVTSMSGFHQRDLSYTPTQYSNSTSSDEEYFAMDTGCSSIESCKMMTNEIGSLLVEMIPHESSILSCYTMSKRKGNGKKRKTKRL